MQDKNSPYLNARSEYSQRLKILMDNDYKQLDMYYSLSNKVNDEFNNGKLDLLDTIDKDLEISREITIIHERIRKRLHF